MSTASKAVQLAVTAAKADAAIRAKVRINSKDRYWTATLRPGYVNIGKPISYAVALNEIRNGRNVFLPLQNQRRINLLKMRQEKTLLDQKLMLESKV